MIKDSGERTEFSTGAVRDMHEGKGRFDLLPWFAIHEVAKHSEEGAIKYGEHNIDKGIPQHSLIDSMCRHLAKHIMGLTDEDHLRAACWNGLWALQQRTTHPELLDVPWQADIERRGEPTKHAWLEKVILNNLERSPCIACLHRRSETTKHPCRNCAYGVLTAASESFFEPDWDVLSHAIKFITLPSSLNDDILNPRVE